MLKNKARLEIWIPDPKKIKEQGNDSIDIYPSEGFNPIDMQVCWKAIRQDVINDIFESDDVELVHVIWKRDTENVLEDYWKIRIPVNNFANWSEKDISDWQDCLLKKIMYNLTRIGYKVNLITPDKQRSLHQKIIDLLKEREG